MKSDNDKLKLKEEIVNLQNKTNRHDVLQNTTDTAMQEEMKFDMSKGTAHFLQNLIRRQTEQKEEIMDINRKMLYFTDKLKQERNHHIKLGRKIESMSKELDEIESTEQMSNYDTQMYFPDLMKTMSTDTFSFVSWFIDSCTCFLWQHFETHIFKFDVKSMTKAIHMHLGTVTWRASLVRRI